VDPTERKKRRLRLHLDDENALAAAGMRDDGSSSSEAFLEKRRCHLRPRSGSVTLVPQLRKTQQRQVSEEKFFARIATAVLYPGVAAPERRSELASWLNIEKAHIICVHFRGTGPDLKEQRNILEEVVNSSKETSFDMCDADPLPMALVYQDKYNLVTCTARNDASNIPAAVFEIHRRIIDVWAAPYRVGVVHHVPVIGTGLGHQEFNDAMTLFHDAKVSIVSVHGITSDMVHGIRANLMLINPLWRRTPAGTAVADIDGKFDAYKTGGEADIDAGDWQWVAIPHYMLSLAPVAVDKVKVMPSLDKCPDVDEAMLVLADKSVGLDKFPATFKGGPAVTFPIGVQAVELTSTDAEEPTNSNVSVPFISHVFQYPPAFYTTFHVVLACFGKFGR